jgi:D-glycero-D-manno-heptose 1,7-bisphosphate phosphatase
MLLRAQADLNLDLSSSILKGDILSDIQAGSAAGVGTQILLSPEGGEGEVPKGLCHVFQSLDDILHQFFSSSDVASRNRSQQRKTLLKRATG